MPLTLPLRLRWQGALGQTIEVTQTLDSSRGGLLFFRTEALPVNARLWVTFPYSVESVEAQPETPARVVRVKTTPGGGQIVAIAFESQRKPSQPPVILNRRNSQRLPFALPISVRFHEIPWPEQTMTQDISNYGVLFRTSRQYSLGDVVCVSIPHGIWARRGEMEAHVVRIDKLESPVEHGIALAISSKKC
ncbi:MAG: PilZ domain-containing protein [Acidobacteria bacterium]|nr:PilZ domain-containing protein [Acidobacteriota bacterium]